MAAMRSRPGSFVDLRLKQRVKQVCARASSLSAGERAGGGERGV